MKANFLLGVMIASAVSAVITCLYSGNALLISGSILTVSTLLFGSEVSKDEDE